MKCGKLEILGKFYQYIVVLLLVILLFISYILTGDRLSYAKDSKTSQAEEETRYKSYTSIEIKSGDSLWSIASEYMTEDYNSVREYVQEIRTLNGLNDDEIHAGKFLLVPYYLQQ